MNRIPRTDIDLFPLHLGGNTFHRGSAPSMRETISGASGTVVGRKR